MRVDWSKSLVALPSDLSIAKALSDVEPDVEWIVFGEDDLFYAIARRELEHFARYNPEQIGDPARLAFKLRELIASHKLHGLERPENWPMDLLVDGGGLTSTRFVALDANGDPTEVGAAVIAMAGPGPPPPVPSPPPSRGRPRLGDIFRRFGRNVSDGTPGSRRSTHKSRSKPPTSMPPDDPFLGRHTSADPPSGELAVGPADTELVPAILSARAPKAIQIGRDEVIDVRVELKEGATPFENAISADIKPDEKIRIILSARRYDILLIDRRTLLVDPPAQGEPREVTFIVQGLKPGESALAVSFQQGGTELGAIRFKLTVSEAPSPREVATATVYAVPRNLADDDVILIQVDGIENAASPRFKYRVSSRLLNLESAPYESREFKPSGNSPQAALEAFVARIYDDLTRRLANSDDVALFEREVKAIGMDLCQQLFSPELAKKLWNARKDIKAIKIVSFEPSVPWELLRLQHPETNQVDDKHLCEYGLVRSMSGRRGAARLALKDWRTVTAEYPNKSLPDVGVQMRKLMQSLMSKGISAMVITPEPLKLLEALERDNFDVLHIACHGESDVKAIDNAAIILSDRPPVDGKPSYVSINARTLSSVAPRDGYSPLVFVNACETGRQAASLTDWGGLPSAFWDLGAGAYVGTSWSVRETPAREFAEAFYNSLLSGDTLAEASANARQKAKLGDASWLAYAVYGDPTSRKM